MKVTVLDYSLGNLHSIRRALEAQGADVELRGATAEAVEAAEVLVLPGVGAFGPAAERVAPAADALRGFVADGRPLLGVCLGMQLLLEGSEESPGAGLGIVPGRVERLKHPKLPQVGWNVLEPRRDDPVVANLPPDPHVYYVNSFVCHPRDPDAVVATTPYGEDLTAILRTRNAYGTQFHPEKSGPVGLGILAGFLAHAEAQR